MEPISFSYLLSALVLPPTSLVLLTLLGLLLLRSRPRLAIVLMAASQLALLALAMPVVAGAIARGLEPPPLAARDLKSAQAIVILAGGLNRSAIEWGGESVNDFTCSGCATGRTWPDRAAFPCTSPAGCRRERSIRKRDLMAKVLVQEYGITPKWIDNAAETTRGNAQMAAKDLKPLGVQRIVLVTTAIHMPRSKRAFEVAGFSVIPAATDYVAQRPFTVAQLMPRVSALTVSYYALREWISRGWYRLLGS